MGDITVYKGRTKILGVKVMEDVSGDVITSQIRAGKNRNTPIIAEWDVQFVTDGRDGDLIFVLDDTVTAGVAHRIGYFDAKRLIGGDGGEPVQLISEPLMVVFREVVTE